MSFVGSMRKVAINWREIVAVPGRLLSPLGDRMPKGLYARSLLIIITPIVILQAVVAYIFMEKHWQSVTARLSAATTKDIAAIIELYETSQHSKETTDRWSASPSSSSACRSNSARWRTCRRPGRSHSSPFSTRPCRARSPSASLYPFGSIRSGAPISSRSASASMTRCCAFSPAATRPMPPTATSSWSGWSARRWC